MNEKLEKFKKAIELACQPTSTRRIVEGREAVLNFGEEFALSNIEKVAAECLNLNDYWEYRRYLELCEMLDSNLTQRVVMLGMNNDDPDVREASDDFNKNT